MSRRARVLSLFAAAALAAGGLASCGDDAQESSDSVTITGAWARTSPSMVTVGASYFQITSPVDDRLVAVSVDPSIAGMVEIHETVPAEGGEGMSHGDGGDMSHGEGDDMSHGGEGMAHGDEGMAMTMREMAGGLPLPAGETVVLAPGGYHLMLMGLVEPLTVGSQIELVLNLENAGEVPLTVEVRDEAPDAG